MYFLLHLATSSDAKLVSAKSLYIYYIQTQCEVSVFLVCSFGRPRGKRKYRKVKESNAICDPRPIGRLLLVTFMPYLLAGPKKRGGKRRRKEKRKGKQETELERRRQSKSQKRKEEARKRTRKESAPMQKFTRKNTSSNPPIGGGNIGQARPPGKLDTDNPTTDMAP